MNIGNKYEDKLAALVADPLLIDYVHLRPKYKKALISRELCDVLIENQPLAIPIQLKVQGVLRKNSDDWLKKETVNATKQILGALRSLNLNRVVIDNPRTGIIEFLPKTLKAKHGIIILDYKGDSSALPAVCLRRTKDKIPLHYLTLDDFSILCQHLMTLPDLVDYLDKRGEIPEWALPRLNDERNVYAYYLTHGNYFGPTVKINDFVGEWDRLTQKHAKEYKEKLEEDKQAELFNLLLKQIHKEDPNQSTYLPDFIQSDSEKERILRREVTRKLSSIRRLYRREISKTLIEKCEKANTSEKGFNYFCFMPEGDNTAYVFLSSRHSRKERITQLCTIVYCVLNTQDVGYVLGVATENLGVKGRSTDFIMVDKTMKDCDPKAIEDCTRIFKDMEYRHIYDFPVNKQIIT